MARDLKLEEVQEDIKSEKFPISATAIRNDIEKKEFFMDEIVYRDLKKA